jgi:hypothetical protein
MLSQKERVMRLPHSYFKLEAVWMLALALAPVLTGLLIVLLVRALR